MPAVGFVSQCDFTLHYTEFDEFINLRFNGYFLAGNAFLIYPFVLRKEC